MYRQSGLRLHLSLLCHDDRQHSVKLNELALCGNQLLGRLLGRMTVSVLIFVGKTVY